MLRLTFSTESSNKRTSFCGRETKPKRKRGGGIDHAASDDSDFDDLHKIAGATAALRLGGESQAGSAAAQSGHQLGARSATARSMTGKSFAGETEYKLQYKPCCCLSMVKSDLKSCAQ